MNELLCPICKSVKHTVLCLTSNPPQFEYRCNNCGHSLKYYERDNSFLPISQKELDVKSGNVETPTVIMTTIRNLLDALRN